MVCAHTTKYIQKSANHVISCLMCRQVIWRLQHQHRHPRQTKRQPAPATTTMPWPLQLWPPPWAPPAWATISAVIHAIRICRRWRDWSATYRTCTCGRRKSPSVTYASACTVRWIAYAITRAFTIGTWSSRKRTRALRWQTPAATRTIRSIIGPRERRGRRAPLNVVRWPVLKSKTIIMPAEQVFPHTPQ